MRASAHQIGLAPAEGRQIARPHRRIIADDELVKLRRGNGGRGQHRMDLPAMVGLMLEQMRQKIVHPVVLNPLAPINRDDTRQGLGRCTDDKRQQARITIALRRAQAVQRHQAARLVQRGAVQPAAFQCSDVKPVHQQNMVQRGADRGEDPAAGRGIVFGRQGRAGGVQPVVGKPVHLRQFAPDTARVG